MLKIGIVGAGGMGAVHISNYEHIEGCKVVAICDLSPVAKEKASEMNVPLFESISEMAKNVELDIIDICTPTFLHKQHVMQALNEKKHVICEKPLALKKADALELITKAEKMGVILFVGQVLQYAPTTIVLKNIIESNKFGKVLDASFLRLSACPRWAINGWLFDKEKSGHLPFDLHIHDLDLIVSLFGVPDKFTFTSVGNGSKKYKEHYRFIYTYCDKSIMAEAAWYNADIPFTAQWRVYFENAVVENNGETVVAYSFDNEPQTFDLTEKVVIPTGVNLPPTGMFYNELTDFFNQINNGAIGCVRKDEILAVIGLLEEINLST